MYRIQHRSEGISPIVATVLMVFITIALAAILYQGGHGPLYWNYHGAACELVYNLPYNEGSVESFFENYSFLTSYVGIGSARGSFNRTQGELVLCNIEKNQSYTLSVRLDGRFNNSGRCSFTSENRMRQEIEIHYESDNESFSSERDFFIQIFKEYFGREPVNVRYFPSIEHGCFQSHVYESKVAQGTAD